MPLVFVTRAMHGPNLLSLSRSRYFGASPYGVASRNCCATQASVGERVTPTWITLRDAQLDDEERKERPKEQIGDLQARHTPRPVRRGCARSVVHLWPRGWWVRPPRMYFGMVRLQTRRPSLGSSPRIRSAPQSRLSCAISRIKAMVSEATLGLVRRGLGLALPIEAQELPRPSRASSLAGR